MALIGDNFIFIHVPRTGGISIRSQLNGTEFMHNHCRFCDIPDGLKKDKYSFGFIREPVDWLVSLFFYVKNRPYHYDYDKAKKFEKYASYYIDKMLTEEFNEGTDYYCRQRDYLNGVSDIFKFENRKEAYEKIQDETGITLDYSITKNESIKSNIEIKKSTIELINFNFKTDYL